MNTNNELGRERNIFSLFHGMKISVFWDIMPCSPIRFISALLATCFMSVSCLAYSSTLKMEGTYSYETSIRFQRTTRYYYIP
jgi:hypothetical protein